MKLAEVDDLHKALPEMKTINTPSGQLIQTCLFCKHFYWSGWERGYSEYTPSRDMRLDCDKDHWGSGDLEGGYSEDFRDLMLKAQTCGDYEAVKEVQDEP